MAESPRVNQPALSPQPASGAVGAAWDELTDASGQIRPHWQSVAAKFQRWSAEERSSIASNAGRMIADLGTTFNVYSDAGGAGQPYELDPIPMMVSPADWAHVSAGLSQRIRLIDAVLTDLYGPQQLLREGLVPPDLVNSSTGFLQYVRGVLPAGGRFVVTTGCDLIRSPSGAWTVLRDHTSAPGGLGQVLENRNVTSNLLSDQFDKLRICRLGSFLETERATLECLMPLRGEMPNVVFLTPGFRHPSYFEHAYKARILGVPLVEPADLTVRERRLLLKTLSGLRRIDGVICRVDESGLDPLEHFGRGGGGVPGLIEAWRTGNVALANAPGAGFASTPALMPFLPGICRKWFGEEIKLPFVETWWLSQADVRKKVLDQLHRYVLLPAFKEEPHLPLRCASLTPSARKNWMAIIEERPHDFVAQLDVEPSTAPSLEARGIRSRPVMWRAFTVNSPDGPVVLPGGLAKIGKSGQAPQLWPNHAGFTKDVWIPEADSSSPLPTESKYGSSTNRRHPSALEVPSRIAEQLFWVGRYAERIENLTRLLRVTLRNLGGEAGRLQREQLSACLSLMRGSNFLPKETAIPASQTLAALSALIQDQTARGGIPYLTRSLLFNAAAARDRLSDDTWRFFNRLEGVFEPSPGIPGATELLRALDSLILNLSAIAGMQAENMTRGQGWRFLEVGRRIERALGGLALLRTAAEQKDPDTPLLGPLLETCDSVMTYRRRHFSRPQLDAVMELIFFDLTNPRAVAYQLAIISQEITRFAGDPEFGLLPEIRGHLQALGNRFENKEVPDATELKVLSAGLESFADMLTQHYFSHSVRRVY